MRILLVCVLMAAATFSVAGCNDLGVGKRCLATTGTGDGGITSTKIDSPSLECYSRLCYQQAATNGKEDRLYCTARCVTDKDCQSGEVADKPGTGRCPASQGFVCAVASPVGDFACEKFCICKDDLVKGTNLDDEGNVVCPNACKAYKDPTTGAVTNKCPQGK